MARSNEMSFLGHLEVFRWHIIRSVIALIVFTIAAFIGKTFIIDTIIMGPSRPQTFWTYVKLCELGEFINSTAICIQELPFSFLSRKFTGQFTSHIGISVAIGFIVTFPYTFWEMWRFIKPGLHKRERRAARGATFSVSFLFILGVLFGYFFLFPISLNFFANYTLYDAIDNKWEVSSYTSTLTTITVGCGLLFQLPVLAHFLTKAGLLTPTLLRRYRKHAILVIFLLAAFVTPPDPITQILIALPLLLLYQTGIGISRRVLRRQYKREMRERAQERQQN